MVPDVPDLMGPGHCSGRAGRDHLAPVPLLLGSELMVRPSGFMRPMLPDMALTDFMG